MPKRVKIELSLHTDFIGSLNAGVQVARLYHRGELTPIELLALVVLAEARGATEQEVEDIIVKHSKFEGEIAVISDGRVVVDLSDAPDLSSEDALLREIRVRTVLEEAHIRQAGQLDVAKRLVKKGKLRRSMQQQALSGDSIPVYKLAR